MSEETAVDFDELRVAVGELLQLHDMKGSGRPEDRELEPGSTLWASIAQLGWRSVTPALPSTARSFLRELCLVSEELGRAGASDLFVATAICASELIYAG